MQGYTAYQVKPTHFQLNQPKFPAIMAAFPEGGGVVIFIFFPGENPVKFTDPDGRSIWLFGFELFQTPQTGDAKVDAANKIVYGLAKVLLGKLIMDGSIGAGAALTGVSSGAATVAGIGIAVVGTTAGAVVSADGLMDIVEGSLSLMQGSGNERNE